MENEQQEKFWKLKAVAFDEISIELFKKNSDAEKIKKTQRIVELVDSLKLQIK